MPGPARSVRVPPLVLELSVVLAWLLMVWLAYERFRPATSASQAGMGELLTAAGDGPGAEWVGIYLEGQKIGAGLADTLALPNGYRIQERTWLKLRAFEQNRDITTIFIAQTDKQHRLKNFRFVLSSPPSALDVSGEVRGALLDLTLRTGEEETRKQVPLTEVPEVSLTFKARILEKDPAVGETLELPYFDPATLASQTLQVKVVEKGSAQVNGTTTPTYTLEASYHGFKSTSIVTRDGRTLSETNALGMSLKRETREEAMSFGKEQAGEVDIIALSAVPVDRPIPNARSTVSLDAHLWGGGVEVLLGRPTEGRPVGTVQVRIPPRSLWKTYQIPSVDVRLSPYLADEDLLQVKNPRIQKTAQSILGDITNAEDAVARLNAWVHERLTKEPVMGVPSALEILENARGDCNEHTTLFTALARSVGIPTQMAAGVVYSEEVTGAPAFYYHAWPVVYLGEWIPVDPTFGQFPADATHIRLVEGSLSDQLALLRVVGNLQIRIEEVR